MKESINAVQSDISLASYGAIPNQIRVLKLPMRTLYKINPSRGNGCCVAVRNVCSPARFMQPVKLMWIIDDQIIFTPAPVSGRQ